MKEFEVEKNVPPPPVLGLYRETLRKMEVGDSISVTSKEAASFLRAGHQIGYTVTTRKINGGGHRVWLVSKTIKKLRCRETLFTNTLYDAIRIKNGAQISLR